MRTSPTKPQNCAGFTLVEMLVVMTIIALASALVVFTLPPASDTALRDSGERLAAQIQVAADRAVLSGNATGMQISSSAYRMLRRTLTGWQSDPFFEAAQVDLADTASIELTIEGERIPLPADLSGNLDTVPDLFFTATGDHPMFALTLIGDSARFVITPGDGSGGGFHLREGR